MNPFRYIKDHAPNPKNSDGGILAVVGYYVAILAVAGGVIGLVCKILL